jgi:hypothetical protein
MLEEIDRKGQRIYVTEDENFPDEKPTLNAVDGLMFRGVSINREENDAVAKYHVYSDPNIGVVCFTHYDLQNYLGYMDQINMEELHKRNR